MAFSVLPDVVQYLKQATSSLSASSTPTAPIAIGGKGKALVNKAVRVEEVPQTDSDDSSDYSEVSRQFSYKTWWTIVNSYPFSNFAAHSSYFTHRRALV